MGLFGSSHSLVNHIINHTPLFAGEIWYVNTTTGKDTNSGRNPHKAFATIGKALTQVSAGDAITIKEGSYDESGLDVDLNGVELWGEIGVIISDTTGSTQTLLVSGNSCMVKNIKISQSGQIGVKLTGSGCIIEDVATEDATVAYDIDGTNNILQRCQAVNATTTGYDISNTENILYLCNAINNGASTRGFYISNSASDENMIYQCLSTGNATAGYEVVSGATYNVFAHCSSGGGDGDRVDLGSRTQWAFFEGRLPREKH